MKLARVAIFLTGMIGLMMGGLVTITTLKTNQDEEAIRSQEGLKTEAALLVEQFHSVIETTRKLSAESAAPSYLMHRGTLKFDQGVPSEWEYLSIADPSYEERILQTLKEQISIADLRLSGLSLGMIDLPEGGAKKGLFVAALIPKGKEGSGPERALVSLVDPVKALPGLGKLSIADESAFLIFKNGKVLAHTLPAYVGADLMRIPDLKESISNLFLGAQTGFVQKYSPIEGARQRLAVVRAGAQPFAVGVERRAPSAVLSAEWFAEQSASGAARKNLGGIFILLACSLFLFAGFSSWAARRMRREIETAREGRLGLAGDELPVRGAVPAHLGENPPSPPAPSLEGAVDDFVQTQAARESEQRVSAATGAALSPNLTTLNRALIRIEGAYALEAVERELVSSSAEWTEGHALYFRYQPKIQNLTAVAVSRDLPAGAALKSQIYVRKDIEEQVEQFAASGKAASLTHYAPLKREIQGCFENAHYEAWAVTSTAEVSGKTAMVGVLVLLHSGEIEPSVRPILGRLIRESGNFLLALGNKIPPRANRRNGEVRPEGVEAADRA